MKKIIIFILILTFIISLSSCDDESEIIEKKYYSTWSVLTGSIDISNSYVWYVEWQEMVNLSTKVWWKITNIFVKQWDYVKSWDLLVKLDSLEAKVWYSTAESIVNTLYLMKESTALMFDQQILSMEAKVEQVKLWDEWMKIWLNDTISITNSQLETAKTWVDTARINLEHTKTILFTKEAHIYDNSKDAIVSAIILDTNIIKFVDVLLWMTSENRDKNDSYENFLSAKDSSYLKDAELKFNEANKLYLEYKSFYDEQIDWKSPDKETILIWLNDWEELAEELKSLLDSTYNVLDNTIDSIKLPQTSIDNYKNTIFTFWNNIEASLLTVSWEYILWLKWSRQGLDDFDKVSLMQIDLLEKQLLLAEKTLAQYEAMSKWQINEVETKSNITASQLDEILALLEWLKKQKETKLREIDAKINEAKWQRSSAWVMIDNWEIRAPISWIILSKMAEEGQVVWWWIPVLVISNKNNLELNILVTEDISKNIKLWEEVLLEIDWLDKNIFWKITNILSSKDLITKKIPVEISFENTDWEIKVWSYAKVIFTNKGNGDNIIISNDAIISKFMIPWVYILSDWVVQFKNIEILKQNDSFSEVKWLDVWEIIIRDWKENIWDWEELK